MRLTSGNQAWGGFHGFLRAAALIGIAGLQHHCGTGTALRAAEAATPQAISGTVTDFKVKSLEIGVKTDRGEAVFFTVGPQTEVVQIPPGERDLNQAKPAKVTDIGRGDRILVSFVAGLTDARRIVWISATDIAARDAAERLDWQKRGISGIVASTEGNQITLEMRTPKGVQTTTVAVTGKTAIRRYAPDSVSFVDARPSSLAEIAKGDQVRSRGTRSEDGKKITAEDVVFGTFLTKMGSITAVDPAAREIRIQDPTTQEALTVRLTANSQLKMLPDMKALFAAMLTSGGARPDPAVAHANGVAPPEESGFDIAKIIGQLPVGKIEDLKVGSTVIVTSTAGASNDRVTAILLMANADGLIEMARRQHGGGGAGTSATEALSSLHGGMLAGPGGLSIPAILP
jgi:hypothetical protein